MNKKQQAKKLQNKLYKEVTSTKNKLTFVLAQFRQITDFLEDVGINNLGEEMLEIYNRLIEMDDRIMDHSQLKTDEEKKEYLQFVDFVAKIQAEQIKLFKSMTKNSINVDFIEDERTRRNKKNAVKHYNKSL